MPEADYYKTLCALQKDLIDQYRGYLMENNPRRGINDATPHEWDLGVQNFYLKKDNDALRELCEEYREILRGKTN